MSLDKPEIQKIPKNLTNLSGLEKTNNNIDISEAFGKLLERTDTTVSSVAEGKENKLLEYAQERLGIQIEGTLELLGMQALIEQTLA